MAQDRQTWQKLKEAYVQQRTQIWLENDDDDERGKNLIEMFFILLSSQH